MFRSGLFLSGVCCPYGSAHFHIIVPLGIFHSILFALVLPDAEMVSLNTLRKCYSVILES